MMTGVQNTVAPRKGKLAHAAGATPETRDDRVDRAESHVRRFKYIRESNWRGPPLTRATRTGGSYFTVSAPPQTLINCPKARSRLPARTLREGDMAFARGRRGGVGLHLHGGAGGGRLGVVLVLRLRVGRVARRHGLVALAEAEGLGGGGLPLGELLERRSVDEDGTDDERDAL
eukprot:scaffold75295_cov65-Phaeocystis_antarctica.AAC.10